MVGTVGTLLHERNHDATLILQLGSSYASMYSAPIITLPAPALNNTWFFKNIACGLDLRSDFRLTVTDAADTHEKDARTPCSITVCGSFPMLRQAAPVICQHQGHLRVAISAYAPLLVLLLSASTPRASNDDGIASRRLAEPLQSGLRLLR